MTGRSEEEDGTPEEGRSGRLPGWITGLLVVQAIALAIALVTPITPSKTGSTWTPAHYFREDPTYLEEVAASFVVVNVILIVLGLLALVVSRRDRSR